jgi:hypothetical protein
MDEDEGKQTQWPFRTCSAELRTTLDTLELLLRMVSGLPLGLPIVHYDVVDKILFAAEKYDMPGPMSIMRLLVMTPPLLDQPFRLYTVSCRYGWEDEARFASTQTLTHYLYDPEVRPLLQRLSAAALLNLFELHHSRKEAYVAIDSILRVTYAFQDFEIG